MSEHLTQIEQTATEMEERLTKRWRRRGLDREPESGGYDEPIRKMNNLKSRVQEIVMKSNLRLEYCDRSNEDRSLPFFGHDDTIREILATTPHLKATKDEIRAFYESVADEKNAPSISGHFQ